MTELGVVIPFRDSGGDSQRRRNLVACIRALEAQRVVRREFAIVIVEQDSCRRLDDCARMADEYVFLFNPGLFNKSWAFNVGAKAVSNARYLLFLDADTLAGPEFLTTCLESVAEGAPAVLPFRYALYLTPQSTEQAIADRFRAPLDTFPAEQYAGEYAFLPKGGCTVIRSAEYWKLSGFDERFRGWGSEDHEFCARLRRGVGVRRLDLQMMHMFHTRAPAEVGCMEHNARLYKMILTGLMPPWAGPGGDGALYEWEGESTSLPATIRLKGAEE